MKIEANTNHNSGNASSICSHILKWLNDTINNNNFDITRNILFVLFV